MPTQGLRFLIVDEVTYIKEWDRGIKYLADIGIFDNVILMLTGSDLVLRITNHNYLDIKCRAF